ncbi:MAG: hydroxylamine reductase [Candidatus Cloacimonetes bacterium]|nr:hydroxylamine reductase [Candidatus Cloacimonadota bacterium]
MSMFCYQCQETLKNEGCQYARGRCGKSAQTANLQDLLIYILKGISFYAEKLIEIDKFENEYGRFIIKSLFTTITNTNFSSTSVKEYIKNALELREELRQKVLENVENDSFFDNLPDAATWTPNDDENLIAKSENVGVLETQNEDLRSLRELVTYGLKGICAYADHAAVLGYEDEEIYKFIIKALAATKKDLSIDKMVEFVLEAGKTAVNTMALLDKANTKTYGNPEITEVNIGVRDNPGILISGHDLKDMEELLEQTKDTGVDVYTHGEMLPANYYPKFKKYDHFVGNYGNSWWKQNEEFDSFNGPILMTTNCIIPVKDSYKHRIFTTGNVHYDGLTHIEEKADGKPKDFSEIIKLAKTCSSPQEIETGSITGGFAHNQVIELSDKIVDAVKTGKLKRFIVMAGCDGRHSTRSYFTDVAKELPADTIILTAGCAKYRYNKLGLGDIDGIPRVLDAGQCNDSYSLAVIALKLKEIMDVEDINELPLSFDIAWYEQKAVAVLLALLSLGFQGIRLGPTLPAFLSPNVTQVLVDKFNIKPTGEVKEDVEKMMQGK